MEDKADTLHEIINKAEELGKTSIELWKMKAVEKYSQLLSSYASQIVVGFIFVQFTIFLSVGVSLWLGEILGSYYYGFFITAGFYIVLFICVYAFMRKRIQNSFENIFVKILTK